MSNKQISRSRRRLRSKQVKRSCQGQQQQNMFLELHQIREEQAHFLIDRRAQDVYMNELFELCSKQNKQLEELQYKFDDLSARFQEKDRALNSIFKNFDQTHVHLEQIIKQEPL